ncbi:MAG: MFS transporter [Bdellovibrionaceae bacterium]|nr:MFS transporter [Pseudobdellovibrionaceae bacterium]
MSIQKVLKKTTRAQWSWAFADWANSAYTTTVIAVFFPIFFKLYWAKNLPAHESTFYLGTVNSLTSFLLLLCAPLLGTIADFAGTKKKYLLIATSIGGLGLLPFCFIKEGMWPLALFFFMISNIGYWASNIFYDALIVDVCDEKTMSSLSSIGYSLGYLGGGLLLVLNAFAVQSPQSFGLSSAAEAVKWSFVSVMAWWFLFSIPLFIYVKEPRRAPQKISIKNAFKEFQSTFSILRTQKKLFWFLLAYIFYIDGVNTIIKMAADFALNIGLSSGDLIKAILIVQFVGFPATLLFATVAKKWGDLAVIYTGLFIYTGITIYSAFVSTAGEFYFLATMLGLTQGGLQAMSRSYFGKMVPKNRGGEFFGIYNMVGKFSAILGPLAMACISLVTANARASLLVVIIFFLIGAFFLKKSVLASAIGDA